VSAEANAERVVFRLPDRGYASVLLLQELERPRRGPPLARVDGVWELSWRRRQVDRMEYRFEADGEAFCDPGNPRRAPGGFGERSVVEFPGYRAPAWLDAPDPGPSRLWTPRREGARVSSPTGEGLPDWSPPGDVPPASSPPGEGQPVRSPPAGGPHVSLRPGDELAAHARLWSPPDTDPAEPLPLLVVHDGTEYERAGGLTRLIAHAVAGGRLPACRVALLDAPDRAETYSASARYARALAALLPRVAPATTRAGLGASLGALAMLHLERLHPGALEALYLQSGSYFRLRWDRHEAGFARFGRISRFVGGVLRAGTAARPLPITLTCGTPEENLPNNRAVAAALRSQGHDVALHVNRDAHNPIAWRDTWDPHLLDLLDRAWGAPG
jgi:enterochelin esterase family protein